MRKLYLVAKKVSREERDAIVEKIKWDSIEGVRSAKNTESRVYNVNGRVHTKETRYKDGTYSLWQ